MEIHFYKRDWTVGLKVFEITLKNAYGNSGPEYMVIDEGLSKEDENSYIDDIRERHNDGNYHSRGVEVKEVTDKSMIEKILLKENESTEESLAYVMKKMSGIKTMLLKMKKEEKVLENNEVKAKFKPS